MLSSRRKELILLAYLSERVGRPVARAELASLLWEERDESRARQSLRQALLELKRAVGEGLEIESDRVTLTEPALVWDVAAFEHDIAAGRFADAVSRWGGPFLAGDDHLGGEAFRAWLEAVREGLRRQLGFTLERLVEEAVAHGARAEAIQWAERWTALLPADERGHLELIECLHLDGRAHEALAQYEACLARLRVELQVEPSAELLRLGDRLRHAVARGDAPEISAALMFTPDLVGRDDGFHLLATAWESVRRGRPACVIVHGEGGIGKSRLCHDFVRWLESRSDPLVVLRARAHEAEQHLAWRAARELFSSLPRAPGVPAAPEQALAALAALVPATRERFSRLPEHPAGDVGLEEGLRRVLMEAAAEAPVVAFLDDAPVADEPSRRLILSLIRHPPPGVLLLLTGRTEDWEQAGGVAELASLPELRLLGLRALDRGEVEALLASTLELDPADRQALASRLHGETRGNPFYIIELLRALVEEGRLRPDQRGVWRHAPELTERQLPLPIGVRDVVSRRLSRLGEEARRALDAAAVLGVPFDLELLAEVAGLPPAACESALDQLILCRLVQETGLEGGRFEFAHELVRRHVCQSIPAARSQALSRRAVAALERSAGTDETGRAALARHRARIATPTVVLRRRRLGWLSAAIALVLAAGMAVRLASRPTGPAPSPATVAVLPFSVRGNPDLAYLAEGMATLLSAKLQGAGALRTADVRAVLGLAAQEGGVVADPAVAARIAGRVGAGTYLLGAVVEAGGRLHLEAAAYRGGNSAQPLAQASAEGNLGQLLELVQSLAVDLLPALSGGSGQQLARVAASTTGSLAALKSYLEGEQLFRDGRFGAAVEAFRRAVAQDTTFALAHYRLSVTAWWNDQLDLTAQAAEAAVRHGSRLSDRDRRLLQAWEALLRGDAVEAERLYTAILGREPENVEGWAQLGEVLFHSLPRRGHPVAEARRAFEPVLSFEPEHLSALLHLARVAAGEGRRAELESLARRILAVNPAGEWSHEVRALRAFAVQDAAEERQILDELELATDGRVWNTAQYVAVAARNLDGARRLLLVLTHPTRAPEVRAFAHIALAHLAVTQGRVRAAAAELDRAIQLDKAAGLSYRGLFAALPFLAVSHEELVRVRTALERWEPPDQASSGSSHLAAAVDGLYPAIRLYLLAILSLRQGDELAALRYRSLLEQATTVDEASFARDAAASVRAQHTLHVGQYDVAERGFEELLQLEPRPVEASAFFSRGYERFLHAQVLKTLGRDNEALLGYNGFGNHLFDLVYLGPSYLRRVEIAIRLGRSQEAVEHYRRAAALWAGADPELRPLLDAAGARLRGRATGQAGLESHQPDHHRGGPGQGNRGVVEQVPGRAVPARCLRERVDQAGQHAERDHSRGLPPAIHRPRLDRPGYPTGRLRSDTPVALLKSRSLRR